jgi:hypothetical protein
MSKRRLLVAASMLMLCLLAAVPISAQAPLDEEWLWSQLGESGSSQIEFCVPEAGYCQYYTYVDNENNDGTGIPDNDMGCSDPPQCTAEYRTCESAARHPIEFNIDVSAITYDTDAVVLLGAREPALLSDIARIEFNGTIWRVEREDRHPERESVLWAGHLDPALVQTHPGDNTVKVYLRPGRCLKLFQGWLLMTDWPFDFGPEEEFVPEVGTMALVGSGLAGLAGYAAVRLRSRQALRWRSRE